MSQIQLGKEIRDAIKRGDRTRVIDLIGSNQSVLEMMTPFGTWLHVAAAHGQLDLVKCLISAGIPINRKGGILGGNALNEAASEGHLGIVEFLFSQGGEIDVGEPIYNPLFSAIHGGYTDVAKFLIDAGIDTEIRYTGEHMQNMDALAFAREYGRGDIVNLLTPKMG
jgi:ankyrin repeat protein